MAPPAALLPPAVAQLHERAFARRAPEEVPVVLAAAPAGARADSERVLELLGSFPTGQLMVADVLVEADRVAVRLVLQDLHLSGRVVRVPVLAQYRTRGGVLLDAEHRWDRDLVRRQADQLPREPLLETRQIQGNVLPGFNKDHQALVELRLTSTSGARAGLALLAEQIATSAEVSAFNTQFSAVRGRRGHERALQATWCNVALSFGALARLAPNAPPLSDHAFLRGPSRSGGPSVGSTDETALLIVASDSVSDLQTEVALLTGGLRAGFEVSRIHRGDSLSGPLAGHEHFGFRDGISQPGVRGRHADPPYTLVTARTDPDDPNHGRPGQSLIWPGEFILGYPGQGVGELPGAVSRAGSAWGRNGSFLVFARYRQDVAAFRAFVRRVSSALSREPGGLAVLDEERLAAMLVGRWRSGAPTMRSPLSDDPQMGSDAQANNRFEFVHPTARAAGDPYPAATPDPLGLSCPLPSHIRKTNPRDDALASGEPLRAEHHRMLRRGIPYGTSGEDGADRGLLFLSYQSSIERQFESIFTDWVGNRDLRMPGEGVDPFLGQPSDRGRSFGLPVRGPDGVRVIQVDLGEPWISLTASGYYFAPSVAALRELAEG